MACGAAIYACEIKILIILVFVCKRFKWCAGGEWGGGYKFVNGGQKNFRAYGPYFAPKFY